MKEYIFLFICFFFNFKTVKDKYFIIKNKKIFFIYMLKTLIFKRVLIILNFIIIILIIYMQFMFIYIILILFVCLFIDLSIYFARFVCIFLYLNFFIIINIYINIYIILYKHLVHMILTI